MDKAFEAFWKADTWPKALKAVEKMPAASMDFDHVYARLKEGRQYRKEKTGEFYLRYTAGVAGTFENRVEVPSTYDPSRKWPLRVQLHGGVNRPQASGPGLEVEGEPGAEGGGRGGGAPSLRRRQGPNRIAGEPQIYIYPSGWADAQWWQASQVDNVAKLVDQVTRRYNVDESQVYLTGISDGGTGAYYLATRDATRWASVLPLNGSIIVLNNRDIGVEGEVFAGNLVNTPLYVVNGGRDPLYPVAHVETHIEWLKKLGVTLRFSPEMNAGHDTSWWPVERTPYERFVHEHPRDSHPQRLSWETERTDRFNRVRWLVIDALGAAPERHGASRQRLLHAARGLGSRRRGAARQCVHRHHEGREAVPAPAVPGRGGFLAPGHGHGQRPAGVRGTRDEEPGNPAPVGRTRQ